MPNMRQEPRAPARGFLLAMGPQSKRRIIMRLALLGCAAALTLTGAAAAQAETIYMNGPNYVNGPEYVDGSGVVTTAPEVVATEPDYTYSVPGPLPFSRYVVTEHAPAIVAEQPVVLAAPPAVIAAPPRRVIAPRARVVATRPARVANAPMVIAPREAVAPRRSEIVEVVAPRQPEIVTTGYSTVRSCFTDLIGVERCY